MPFLDMDLKNPMLLLNLPTVSHRPMSLYSNASLLHPSKKTCSTLPYCMMASL